MEVDEKASGSQSVSLVFGHGEGQLWALSPHPTEAMFATGSYDRNLVVWNISTRVRHSRFSSGIFFCKFSLCLSGKLKDRFKYGVSKGIFQRHISVSANSYSSLGVLSL